MKINFIPLQKHGDDRGSLVALEEENNILLVLKEFTTSLILKKVFVEVFMRIKN